MTDSAARVKKSAVTATRRSRSGSRANTPLCRDLLSRSFASLDSHPNEPSPKVSSLFSTVTRKAPALSIRMTSENQIVRAR
jgi:hypothetical protein